MLAIAITGFFLTVLLYFLMIMEAKAWDYHIAVQILIYIGLMLGVVVHDYILAVIFTVLVFCLTPDPTKKKVFTMWGLIRPLLAYIIVLIILPMSFGIWKFISFPQPDYADRVLYLIHLGAYAALGFTVEFVIICKMKMIDSKSRKTDRQENFRRHRISEIIK